MRDFLRRFQREPEFIRRQRLPVLDRLRRRNAVKGVIDLGGGETFGIKRQHLRRRQILWVKISFPFGVLEAGSTNPCLHVESE